MSATPDPLIARDHATPRPAPDIPALRVRDVAIRHEHAEVPSPAHVSFDVRAGEVVLLLGPSGAGKSTLALALNGLVPHAVPADLEGRIEVDGVLTTETTVAHLSTRVAMVFQDPDSQIVTGSLLDEVAFGPENLLLPVDDVLARTRAALTRVGLWERRDDNPERLSGGGRQRLAIACALAMGSRVLVLDEPTANLDPSGVDDVYDALADLVSSGEHAIVLVEHNLDRAIPLVDRVVVMDGDGRLVADGTPDDILRERAEELMALGVWLPTATLAALRLRAAGYPLAPLPLETTELRERIAALPPLPRAASSAAGSSGARALDVDAAPAPALISVRGLDVERRRTRILHDIDLEVRAGEFLAIVGANGAGKTTLLQAIAGVVPPPRGRIRVAGIDPGRVDVARLVQSIGFVFQNPEHQFIAGSVQDELAHGLRRLGLPEDTVQEKVDDMLGRFGLRAHAATHPFQLSGGQKRRLSVGTALVTGAPVLALDEPTFGQDRARADELLAMLAALNSEGTTVLVVTHDMQLVAEHASHVAVLAGGRLLAHRPARDVFADDDLLRAAGLRRPPLAAAFHDVPGHPELDGRLRLSDLPDGAR